ncbi:Archaeal PaREP1/PaREP8 family [Azospirillaceae bacterium]
MTRTYTRKEVSVLLTALERQAREAATLATTAEHEASKHSFAAYQAFRDKVGEFQALVILIEGRLRNLVDSHKGDDLREQFERLDTLMLSLLVRASMRFFFVLSANPIMPLGAREIFMSELRSLHDARDKLSRPEYAGKISTELSNDLDMAETILEEIIEKAPNLLSFGR